LIELLVIGATVTIAAWAAGAQAHRRFAAGRALDRYAQSRGLVFVPAPENPRGASPRVLGSKEDVDYVVDLYKLGDEVRTRVSGVIARGARTPVLSVAQRGAFAWNSTSNPETTIGDAAFDATYVVTSMGSPEDAESLKLTIPSLLLLNGRRGVWLSSDGSRVSASWQGMESDPVILDAARDAVVMVASWHRPESPYR